MHSPLKNRKYLVTGASGYVGGRLVKALVDDSSDVRILVRDRHKVQGQPWASAVEICEGSAENRADLDAAVAGVHTAYYLLHSINLGPNFDDIEAQMARDFAQASEAAGVSQIVYLGGIANDVQISKHLASRVRTGKELASSSVPVMELRAGIIIGSGSASFEMLRHLTHRLPIMTTPKWVMNRTHPIAIRDVLYYLKSAAAIPEPVGRVFDIGGPEVLTYAEMMQKFAKLSGLKKRWIIKVPVLTPGLSSLWIGLVTPVPTALARPLVGSLISEVVADPAKSIDEVIPPPPEGLTDVGTAINLALSRIIDHGVETRWSDATSPTAPWQKAQGDPEWAGEMVLRDRRETTTDVALEKVWKQIEGIGGEHGWFGSDFLWWGRGVLDRCVGGVGLRRGRRDPDYLRVGESLDFWRVEELDRGHHLKLYAEMVLPGKAWLEFTVTQENGKIHIVQEATFNPRGLGGQLYWYAISPFHFFVFPTMLRNIVKKASKDA
ncbi:MAG: SDR family oxidoreductase [Candidatus Planktophila sp.]|nr:SDR family oxidoreductase [Candidatus Planktophila sp.]